MELKSKEDVQALVVKTLSETFGLPQERLVPGADLYKDLEIDSIDAIDLLVKLQKLSGKRMAPEAFKSVRTLDDVVEAIHRLIQQP
jgi:acyl carrier protein